MNHGADKNAVTIEDLIYLDFNDTAIQLLDFNKTYFPKGVPQGPDNRQLQFDKYSEEQIEDDIKEMNNEFWKISDKLDKVLLEHINKTEIGKD